MNRLARCRFFANRLCAYSIFLRENLKTDPDTEVLGNAIAQIPDIRNAEAYIWFHKHARSFNFLRPIDAAFLETNRLLMKLIKENDPLIEIRLQENGDARILKQFNRVTSIDYADYAFNQRICFYHSASAGECRPGVIVKHSRFDAIT
jgi:hypothetical protein